MITSAGASKPVVSYRVPVEDTEATQRGTRPAQPVPETQFVPEVQPQDTSVQGVEQAGGGGLKPGELFSQDRFEEAGVAQALAQGAGLQLRQPQAGVPGPANDQSVGQASTDSRLNSPVFTRDEFESADVRRSGPVDLTGGGQEPRAVDDPTQAQELQTEQEEQAQGAEGEEKGGVKGKDKEGGKKDDKKKPQITRTTEKTKVGSSPDSQVTVERDFIEVKSEDGKTHKKLQAIRVKADNPQSARKAAEIEAMERRKIDPDAGLGGGANPSATASLGEALGAVSGDLGSSLGGDFGGGLGSSTGGGDSGGGSVVQV